MIDKIIVRMIIPMAFFYFSIISSVVIWRFVQLFKRQERSIPLYSLFHVANSLPLREQGFIALPLILGCIFGGLGLAYIEQISKEFVVFAEIFLLLLSMATIAILLRSPLVISKKVLEIFFAALAVVLFFIPLVISNLDFSLIFTLMGILCISYCSMNTTILFLILKRDGYYDFLSKD